MTKGRYTCFFHPKDDTSEHDISDKCPCCDRTYNFPLVNAPTRIRNFKIDAPLERGFYAATYVASYGVLGARVVLKVIPKATYDYFGKDFVAESQLHSEVSQGTQHLAGITDAFDEVVEFGDSEILCHISQLQYIDGQTLSEFLSETENRTARNLAQIAVDLFSLMGELSSREKYHNDLHDKNIMIEKLDRPSFRSGESIEPSIRTVAIDLGSLAEMSKSIPPSERLGDLLQIVAHILQFRNYLLEKPREISDVDYRLAIQLDQIGHMLTPDPVNQKEPPYQDIIAQIQDGYGRSTSPWKAPSELKSFSESFNSQTLHPSFVRPLLVDPDDEWLAKVSGKGPQVITGIRGCGKTMLLKAMQSHSQISFHFDNPENDADKAISKIRDEGYIGLYVPTNRLLDALGTNSEPVHKPYERLFVAYAREALRAARHLGEHRSQSLLPGYWHHIAKVVSSYVNGVSELTDVATEIALENELFSILVSLDRGEGKYELAASPAVAFPELAEAVRQLSDVWADATVLFLLDDVSTRNLSRSDIGNFLGTLLFAHPNCAFKMTTEIQTMELILKSPGLIETARVGRDYDTFDLGAQVINKLTDGKDKSFVERILASRSEFYPKHPTESPRELLGDVSLEQIAREIATSGASAPKKKGAYRGIRALAALCVGDIGDVLKIYEAIINHYDGSSLPIPAEKQSGAFQEYSSKQLYHLNRRKGELKDFALGFARAANRLLVQSANPSASATRGQLRQYTQIYVRVTTGNTDWQFNKLRELIDAGVFVLRGGSDVPRTKTRDSNPTQQFILTYRKLYGLSSYIGLSNRDRFELSGEDLLAWLQDPASGADILGRNLGLAETSQTADNLVQEDCDSPDAAVVNTPTAPQEPGHRQLKMSLSSTQNKPLTDGNVRDGDFKGAASKFDLGFGYSETRLPLVTQLGCIENYSHRIATIATSLGFEERTVTSARRLFSQLRHKRALLVSYADPGYSEEIRAIARTGSDDVEEVGYETVTGGCFALPEGEVLLDVTGLAKPVIFRMVVQALSRDRSLFVAHTPAETYYPRDEDIEKIIVPDESVDTFTVLEKAREIWTGEKGPYEFVRMLNSDVDQGRRRLLCAAVSPQHERLLSLVEQRDYDGLCIIEPEGATPRTQLARLAADVATQGRFGHRTDRIGSDDLIGIVKLLGMQFEDFYAGNWFDVEFGLTGSKMHAVACAAVSVVLKIAQCWYVRPAEFDSNRFTFGAKDTRFFRISLP